eukprot:GDKJ01057731.1.p1 GENE.GDKJ01057731.1~~GDKJ01057731.1.p1  ORF type:complete len:866 (+),score=286.93 GDKJ01057731.1:196-2598(+)
MEKKQAEAADKSTPTVNTVPQPSRRAYCTFTPMPTGEVFVFGGEFYDGSNATVLNETYRWNVEKNEWRKIESSVCPKPRCSHQAVAYKDYIYIFGGEFATASQFYHFKDVWRFDIRTNRWEELKTTGVLPSARSGHRMIVWRNYIVVYGGFYDTVKDTKYFGDVCFLSLQTLQWRKMEVPSFANAPQARAACQICLSPKTEQMFIYGGFCKVKDTSRTVKGKILSDMWAINLKPLANLSHGIQPVTCLSWEKIAKKGQAPPVRSGSSMVVHKSVALSFGGVFDEDDGGALRSVFYNDLFAFDMDRKRWFQLSLKTVKDKGKNKAKKSKTMTNGGKKTTEDEEEDEEDEGVKSEEEGEDDWTAALEALEAMGDNAAIEQMFGYVERDGKLVRVRIDDDWENIDDLEADDGSKGKKKEEPLGPDGKPLSKSTLKRLAWEEKEREEAEKKKKFDEELTANRVAALSPAPMNIPSVPASVNGSKVEKKSSANNATSSKSLSTNATTAAAVEEDDEAPLLVEVEPKTPMLKVDDEVPLPRINAQLFVKGNLLYVYGGVVECGDKQVTLDDCWKIDLNSRVKWENIMRGTIDAHPWNEEDESDDDDEGEGEEDMDWSDDEESDDDETSSDEESSSEEESEDARKRKKKKGKKGKKDESDSENDKKKKKKKKKSKKRKGDFRTKMTSIQEELLKEAGEMPLPNSGEELRAYFDRSKDFWINKEAALQTDKYLKENLAEGKSEEDAQSLAALSVNRLGSKEIRRCAFEKCEARLEELAELLEEYHELLDEMAEMENEANNAKSANKRH